MQWESGCPQALLQFSSGPQTPQHEQKEVRIMFFRVLWAFFPVSFRAFTHDSGNTHNVGYNSSHRSSRAKGAQRGEKNRPLRLHRAVKWAVKRVSLQTCSAQLTEFHSSAAQRSAGPWIALQCPAVYTIPSSPVLLLQSSTARCSDAFASPRHQWFLCLCLRTVLKDPIPFSFFF